MSRIRTKQRLQQEDIPKDHRSWMDRIIQTINDFLSETLKILNNGLLFSDNFLGVEHTFEFTYQSDAISLPRSFKWDLSLPPRALVVVAATEDNDPVNVSVSWRYTETGQVELTHAVKFTTAPAVALLTARSKYKIRVRVTP